MIEIRLAQTKDAHELHELNNLYNGRGCTTVETIEAYLSNNSHEIVCVAADGDSLAGFCCGQVSASVCYSKPTGDIKELYVRPAYRRQGIGKQLLVFLESELLKQECRDFNLVVENDNDNAQALYLACGYHSDDEVLFHKAAYHTNLLDLALL